MDMKQLMKQMQAAQGAAQRIQAELGEKTVQGTASGGLVSVVMNGHSRVQEVVIDPKLVGGDEGEAEAFADLLLSALNDASEKVENLQQEATAGLRIPGF